MSDKDKDKDKDVSATLQLALENPNVPKIYMNGFNIGSSNADITLFAQLSGRPTAVLNMSFEIAKTLVHKLGGVVERIEKGTDTEFLTTDDFDKLMKIESTDE